MNPLTTRLPDVDVLLSLAPEELAEVILEIANENIQNGKTHLQYIATHVSGSAGSQDGYPQQKRHAAEMAIAEAWQWLVVQGLLIPELGTNGTNGWMFFSRRAQRILSGRAKIPGN